jgi:hypothetical protein
VNGWDVGAERADEGLCSHERDLLGLAREPGIRARAPSRASRFSH